MVKYLLDTSSLINILNGKSSFVGLLGDIPLGMCSLSVITVGEVLEGVEKDSRKEKEADNIFSKFKLLDIDREVCEKFAGIRKDLRKRGQLIDNMDILIGSTALVHKLTIITGNRRDFERVKGLKLFKEDFVD